MFRFARYRLLLLGLLATVLVAGSAWAQINPDPGWTPIVIRNATTTGNPPVIQDNDDYATDAIEFAITEGGQKAGLASDDLNGARVKDIASLHVERLDDVQNSGSLWGPYFNIWVTDGAGHYAVIANEPSNPEWGTDRWNVTSWDGLKIKTCKVYETPGAAAGTSWLHTLIGNSGPLTFEDVGELTIAPPPVSYITDPANAVGTGAPDEIGTNIAYGYTWVFGDTASNYISGNDGFIVDNYYITADWPVQNVTQGLAYDTIEAALGDADPGDEIYVPDGDYYPPNSLAINQSVTLSGESEAGVVIHLPAVYGYGFSVAASDVTLENFTVACNVANTAYPFHISGTSNKPIGFDNLTMQNITVSGTHTRAGIDIHGYNHVTLSGLTSRDATGGNGFQITGCVDVDMDNITALNNAWGSIAIFCSRSDYMNRGSDDVVIDGATLDVDAVPFSQDEFGLFNTNYSVTGWNYHVTNSHFREGIGEADSEGYTFLTDTQADALATALGFTGYEQYSAMRNLTSSELEVVAGLSIQAAIDAANAGDTVSVDTGVYREQLSITKDLDLVGAGRDLVTVEAPDEVDRSTFDVTTFTGSNRTVDAVIGVNAAGVVNISGFTVDGRETGPDNFYGIYFNDTAGSITDNRVAGIIYPGSPGAQRVISILATHSPTSGPLAVEISRNLIPDFQKGGISIGGPELTFTVNENTVNGSISNSIAGNGIQLSYGASGTTTDNTVTDVGYSGDDWAGTGILLFESGDVTMNGDKVTGSEKAVDYSDWRWVHSHPTPVNLTFNDLDLQGNEWGLSAQLSGDGSDLNMAVNGGQILNCGADAFDVWGTDLDPWGGSYYLGWDNGDLNLTVQGLTLNNTGYDGLWTADLSGNTTNTVHSFTVANCSFTNTVGSALANGFSTEAAAAENYWGDVGGPIAGGKSGGERKTAPVAYPAGVDLRSGARPVMVAEATADKAAETVTGLVDFSPWYGLPLGTTPMTVGTNDVIQDAIDLAQAGDTVQATAGTFTEPAQIVIDKNLTLLGAGDDQTIIVPDFDTTSGGYLLTDALMYIDHGVTALIQDLGIDGAGHIVRHGIQSRGGDVTVRGCEIQNIYANTYHGRGIVFLTGTGLVENCTMSNIMRIGVHIRGAIEPTAPTVTVNNLEYLGKGEGDWLDYAVEVGGGGHGIINGLTATACRGTALVDDSGSAGVLVTDYYGTGSTCVLEGCVLNGNSVGMYVGYNEDDASVVSITDSELADNDDYGVRSTGPVVNALGNWWGAATGPYHPDTNPAGLGNEVTDHVLFDPWSGLSTVTVVPSTSGPWMCGQEVTLTFKLELDDYTPDVFGYNATVRFSGEVTATDDDVEDLLPFTDDDNQFLVTDMGDGSIYLAGTTVGDPSHPISGEGVYDLFSITFTTVTDGDAAITFDNFLVRDPNNVPISASTTGATISVDCTAPAAVTAVTAAPHHNRVEVDWTHTGADVDHYTVYRGLVYDGTFGVSAYPEYDDLAGYAVPGRPGTLTDAHDSDYWEFVADVTVGTNTVEDAGMAHGRGIYYYEVYAVDTAGNSTPAANYDGATNYWLGDVSGDGRVTAAMDIDPLGTAFGTSEGDGQYNAYCDVGPTDDWSRVGLPTTDNHVNFEDLMIFSMNFGVVSATNKSEPVIDQVAHLSWVTYDEGRYALRLEDGAGLKGVRVTAALAEGVVSGVTAGDLLDRQDEMTFLRNLGPALDVNLAVMGRDNGFSGEGDLFILETTGPVSVDDLVIQLRGADNRDVELSLETTSDSLTPRVFSLNANYPNPFNPQTKISFSLPEPQDVRLTVYGVDGRKVATLVNETRSAGLHEVLWTGRDDAGRAVSSGTYFYRIDAGPYSQVRKMTLIK